MAGPVAVFWCGPVSLHQVAGAELPGAVTYSLACYGDRPPQCAELANALLDGQGRRLPALLRQHQLPADTRVALGAFSAGGSVVRRLLEHPADRAQVAAVHLADALWTAGWQSEVTRTPVAIPAIAAYAIEAAADPAKLLIATSSPNPNRRWATGHENLDRLRGDIEVAVGRAMPAAELALLPPPERAYRLGGAILAAYPAAPLGHGHHVLAPQVWQRWIGPHLAGALREPPPGGAARPPGATPRFAATSGPGPVLLAAGAAAAALWWFGRSKAGQNGS